MDVVAWLRGLGLGQYVPAFAANDIDGEVLPELTADDLIGLGVTSFGHRRKLLAAITALRSEAPQPVTEVEPVAAATSGDAERRQLTVMFCDLVGSTPMSLRFDPEDLRDVIGAYQRCVADTVARFAGFVAKHMGDGVLIYFGYPQANEDDAELAVRAGLAVIDAVGRLATSAPSNVRLGIASGLVVVGDLIGEGAAQERGVVGETPNLAARLQAQAQPGTLAIAESTRRQIGGLFEIEDLGPRPPRAIGHAGGPAHSCCPCRIAVPPRPSLVPAAFPKTQTRDMERAMSEPERLGVQILGSGQGGKLLAWHMVRSGRRTAVVERGGMLAAPAPTSPACPARTRSGARGSHTWHGTQRSSALRPARSRPTWRRSASASATW
jgi:class 3 adenylate cyclase